MILTTTPTVPGREIREYKGLVTAETILGAHIGRDLLAGMRDFFGGRARSYEGVLQEAKTVALAELQERAQAMSADAVIGIEVDFGTIGTNSSMLMVSITGTAVKLK